MPCHCGDDEDEDDYCRGCGQYEEDCECDSALFDADELGLDPERDGERMYHEEE